MTYRYCSFSRRRIGVIQLWYHVGNMMKKNPQKKKRMFSWMNPKLAVRDTEKYGKGVFTKGGLKKDETLFVMGGYIQKFTPLQSRRGKLLNIN
jgi:hypothetical protein